MQQNDIYTIDYNDKIQLSTIEIEILNQYQNLAIKLNHLANEINNLIRKNNAIVLKKNMIKNNYESDETFGKGSCIDLLENFRDLEKKTSLVYTLFKGAIYSLFPDQDKNFEDTK